MDAATIQAELRRFGPSAGQGPSLNLAAANAYCRRLARDHYENFTVASWLLPRRWRQPLCNIYAYCRWADDLADETGDVALSCELLRWWRQQVDDCFDGRARHPVFVALRDTLRSHALPKQPFLDLLTAFERDQSQARYETFEDLLSYCRCSADPVGRLVLHLTGNDAEDCLRLSDSICTGLQLANFCQDVAADWDRGRVYLPRESWMRWSYAEADFAARRHNDAFRGMLSAEVDRAETFLQTGWPLVSRVSRDVRLPVRLFIGGGLTILANIRRREFDVWRGRPRVSKSQKLRLVLAALFARDEPRR